MIEAVTVSALTDDTMNFEVLLSNTTRFLPSAITWKSCAQLEGIAYMLHLNYPNPSSIGIYNKLLNAYTFINCLCTLNSIANVIDLFLVVVASMHKQQR